MGDSGLCGAVGSPGLRCGRHNYYIITHYASITRHLRAMVFNAFIVTLVINVTKPAPIEKRSSEPRRNVNSLGRTPPSRLRGGLGACTHTQLHSIISKKNVFVGQEYRGGLYYTQLHTRVPRYCHGYCSTRHTQLLFF